MHLPIVNREKISPGVPDADDNNWEFIVALDVRQLGQGAVRGNCQRANQGGKIIPFITNQLSIDRDELSAGDVERQNEAALRFVATKIETASEYHCLVIGQIARDVGRSNRECSQALARSDIEQVAANKKLPAVRRKGQ